MTKNEFIKKQKNIEFVILNITSKDSNYQEIVNLIKYSSSSSYVYEEKGYSVILSTAIRKELEQTINAITYDFSCRIKVFVSNKISSENIEFVDELINLYLKYEKSINSDYITIRQLVEKIMEKSTDDLKIIKKIVVNKVVNDQKIFEIINGMFINNLNICKTANYVYMHRNTINNKLETIKEFTGLDLQNFQDAVILYVLIK